MTENNNTQCFLMISVKLRMYLDALSVYFDISISSEYLVLI